MYRENEGVRRRLLAHYRNIYGKAALPIDHFSHNEIPYKIEFLQDIDSAEFLVNLYPIVNFFYLYISSRRLILKRYDSEMSIFYADLRSVYLEFPYKKETSPHYLNLITNNGDLVMVEFMDLVSLTAARNEIYKVADTVILNWKGKAFRVGDVVLSDLHVVKLPLKA